jgi:diguanylate cyclase (GGDEF)-like protein
MLGTRVVEPCPTPEARQLHPLRASRSGDSIRPFGMPSTDSSLAEPRRSRLWPRMLLLVAAVAVAAMILSWFVKVASDQLLRADAEHVARAWAELTTVAIDELEPLLQGEPLTEAGRRDLLRHRKVQEVFRFKLFDRQGVPVLVSDDLDRPTAAAPQRNTVGHGDQRVRELVLGGRPWIDLKAGQDATRPAVYSEAYVPLLKDGRVIGVVEVYVDQTERARRVQSAFGRVAVVAFGLLAVVSVIFGAWWLRRARFERRAEERAHYLARHDALSGLLNRSSFKEALDEAAWRHAGGGAGFAVLCVDLDHFKEVNDTQGHAAGDDMLRQVGDRLRAQVRAGDRVARLASDEFALLLAGAATPDAVTTLAERVIASLAEPFVLGPASVNSGCSIGAALFGVDAATPDEVLKKADLALQRAKAAGRGAFHFYDAALDRRLDERRQLVRDLREALAAAQAGQADGQLALHYQPLLAADGCTLKGYEALLRWRHPLRGPIPPVDFIPLAEDSGLIVTLGRWVLQTACADAAGWPGGLTVAVNLSAAQFGAAGQPPLDEQVREVLAQSGLAAPRLEVEITESLLLTHTDDVTATLRALDGLGVKIAMDDFGTGYSSLSYLWRFPFHKVKIDRAFTLHLVDDAKVQLIVRSIVSLARSMGLRVNAEGVETEAQLRLLQDLGCDELQGFLLGRPAPLEQLRHRQLAANAERAA